MTYVSILAYFIIGTCQIDQDLGMLFMTLPFVYFRSAQIGLFEGHLWSSLREFTILFAIFFARELKMLAFVFGIFGNQDNHSIYLYQT